MFDFAPETPPVETKPNVFTLEAMLPWLGAEPPELEYCWADGGDCLFHHYGVSLGLPPNHAYCITVDAIREEIGNLHGIACLRPHTFGSATIRCRAAISTTNPSML